MSYDLRFMLAALSGLAVLFCMVTALKLRLHGRLGPGIACGLATLAALIALFTVEYSTGEQVRLEAVRSREISPRLERYRQAHGQYPARLKHAGIHTPRTRYGRLRYYSGSHGDTAQWYLISFGDPKENGFVADWHSRAGSWTVIRYDW